MYIMKDQKILVTGGAGFIGTNLVNELRSRGHEVLEWGSTDRLCPGGCPEFPEGETGWSVRS